MSKEITPEVQALIDAAVTEATAGLKANNDRLLAEKKRLQKDGAVTPEQLAEVERERDLAQADLAKVTRDLAKAGKDLAAAQKSLADESGFTQKLLIENGLTAELAKNGVTNPVHLKAALAMLKSGAQVVVDGENRVAKFGDKTAADYIKEWAGSDEGKNFVTAAGNSGGGAQGGSGKLTPADISKMSPQQKMEAGRAAVAKP